MTNKNKVDKFAGAIDLDDDFNPSANLAQKAIQDKNSEEYNKFINGDLKTEVSKIMTIKTTKYQFEVVQELAKTRGKTIKSLFLDYVAEEAKKEGLFNQIKD